LRGFVHARARSVGARLAVRAGQRVYASLIALVFVLSTLGGMLHEAATPHVVCAQHGELIHGDAPAAVASPAHAPGTDATLRDLSAAVRHGHDHCALASAMRASRILPRAPVMVPGRVATREVAAAPRWIVAARDRELYRTAPKTSPPT
jgi:hypothetical protein